MRSIVICSSMRFKEDLTEFTKTLQGFSVGMVLEPDFSDLSDEIVQKEEVERLKDGWYKQRSPALILVFLFCRSLLSPPAIAPCIDCLHPLLGKT